MHIRSGLLLLYAKGMIVSQQLSQLSDALLTAACAAGADAADALAVDRTDLTVDVRDGALEQAERSESLDIGLRVLVGQRQACVSASDITPQTIEAMAERAVAMARETPEDPYIGLAPPEDLAQDCDPARLELADPSPPPSPKALEDMAARAEAQALSFNGISQVSNASAGYGKSTFHLATTTGFSAGYTRTSTGLSVVAITGDGTTMQRDYYGDQRCFADDLESPEDIGRIAAERTLARTGAQKPPTGTYPVVFDERIASSLIGHLLSAINGVAIARGASFLRDALGDPVLPKGMYLHENPTLPRRGGSKPFDGEGLPTSARDIVADGILQGWILDLATARKLGLNSTAHAARGTSAPPSPQAGNVVLTQGDKSHAELLKDMGTGLLITSMIGSTINPNTGDYSRGAIGHWVENGDIAYPVHECTVAGNLRDMLARLVPANDARLHLSRAVPSLLVEGLTIAGT